MRSQWRLTEAGSRAIAFAIGAVFSVALIGGAVIVATQRAGGSGTSEVFLEAAKDVGPDPFLELLEVPVPTIAPGGALLGPPKAEVVAVRGDAVGLYGGTLNESVCDREQLIRFLTGNAAQGRAWASVHGITVAQIPSFVRSLTPVQLRVDTRVTNHGFVDGAATPRQSVLQAGTAVLVDAKGVPRARCACGNPLVEPEAVNGSLSYSGERWPGFDEQRIGRVVPGATLTSVQVHDARRDQIFERPVGTDGAADRVTNVVIRSDRPTTTTSTTGRTSGTSTTTASTAPAGPGSTVAREGSTTSTTAGLRPSEADTDGTTTTPRPATTTRPTATSTTTRPATTTTAAAPTTTASTTTSTTAAPTTTSSSTTTTTSDPNVEVPDVVGLSQREAGAKLKNTGFAVTVKERTVPGVLPGTVTEQSPAGGTKAAPGSTVTIVVAVAPEEVTVPALRGRSIEEARKLLSSLGLGISEKESVTPNLECGTSQVTEHSPGPDQVVPVGTVVTVAYLTGACRIG